jgi:hypothetical protein
MRQISRRIFLTTTGAAILAPRITQAVNAVPSLLDHIILGSNDLDRGISFVEEHAGVRAAFGGVHPGRGTRNALLSLGERRYLEIIAPDPKQDILRSRFGNLKNLSTPRLVGWAVHTDDSEALAKRLRQANVSFEGPTDGSRQRPDGTTLRWKTLDLKDDRSGLLPFFIEWSTDSTHPSVDAPSGCRLVSFAVSAPNSDELAKHFRLIQIDVTITHSNKPALHASIAGPQGELALTS